MPQARDSHIPSSGQKIPGVAETQTYATTTKPQTPIRPVESRGGARRRIIFLISIAILVFGGLLLWVGLSSVNAAPMAIASFGVIPESESLYTTFQLANSEGETVSATGSGTIEFYDGSGNLLARQQFSFAKKDFDQRSRVFSMAIPKTILNLEQSIDRQDTISEAVAKAKTALTQGLAILTVTIGNNENTLTASCRDIQLYPLQEIDRVARSSYYEATVQYLEEEINKQWPFQVKVTDYTEIGNFGWAVVGRTGAEIIFYYKKIYDWYLLHTEDGGRNWDIAWQGDQTPSFQVEFPDESSATVITPVGAFCTADNGITWKSREFGE